MTNTVLQVTGEEREIAAMKDALGELVRAGFVVFGIREAQSPMERFSKDASLGVLDSIEAHLHFKSDGGHWTGGEEPWPEIMITDTGYKRAEQILRTRGYQWWRQNERNVEGEG